MTVQISGMGAGRTNAVDAAPPGATGAASGSSPVALMPEPLDAAAASGDVMTELAALLTKADQDDRRTSRTLERTCNEAMDRQESMRVQAMRDKADDDRASGIAEGVGEIAAGGCTITAGVIEANGGTESTGKADGFKGGAQIFSGAGTITSHIYKADVDSDEASAEQHRAAADCAERSAKAAHESVQGANESLRKIADWLKEMHGAQASSNLTAAAYRV